MAFGKRVDGPGGRRRKERERVVLAAAAVTLDSTQPVVVDDVCPTGVRLRGRGLPKKGEDLVLKIGHVDVMGFVAWSDGAECGVTFDAALDPGSVTQLKEEGSLGRVLGIL
ncbi:MAG: hypothetical protein H0V46_08360 [Sphingomonas sp.]|nr:hypothetical protein [Sphingomonas sp.]